MESKRQKRRSKPKPIEPPRAATVDEWVAGLDDSTKRAFNDWAGFSSGIIRAVDIGVTEGYPRPSLDKAKADLQLLRKAIRKAPHYKGTIYRGLYGLTDAQLDALSTAGNQVSIDALSSFSKSERIAAGFAKPAGDSPGHSVLFKLESTKGGHDIAHSDLLTTTAIREQEVIVEKGARYRVTDSMLLPRVPGQAASQEYWQVTLEEI